MLALVLAPHASEAHYLKGRTPVVWTDAACMTTVDRSVDPIVELTYDIPVEDLEPGPMDVADSRTHQFIGFCRDHHTEESLPNWVSEADVAAALAAGQGMDEPPVDLEHDVLDNAPDWAGCWTRITPDDARRPISFEAATEPVAWDTSELAAGTWVVEGFTNEPWHNLWSPHPGVFKIVDDPDPAASPPAAALTFDEQVVFLGNDASISGCVDAMPGSTMALYWARAATLEQPDWQLIEGDLPTANGSFDYPFSPTEVHAGGELLIKLEVTDPMDRAWTAHAIADISVIDTTPGDDSDSDSDADSETGGSPASGDGGCRIAGPPTGGFAGGLALLALIGLRRRRDRV